MSIMNYDKLGRGKCTITITDKETGEVILKTDAFLVNYEMRHERQPIHMLGRYDVMDYISPQFVEMTLTAKVFPWEEEKIEEPEEPLKPFELQDTLSQLMKALEAGSYNASPSAFRGEPLQVESLESVFCGHTWKKYEGFTDVYDYCEKCNEKRK